MGYKKYVKDYKPKIVSVDDGRGVKEIYVYNGPHFAAHFPSETVRKKTKLLCALAAVVCCISFVAAGLVDAPAARKIYIVVPYVVEMVPTVFFALGTAFAIRAPEKMKREEVDRSWRRARMMSGLLAAIAGLVFIESTLLLILTGDFSPNSILFSLLAGVSTAAAGAATLFLRKNCRIEEIKN